MQLEFADMRSMLQHQQEMMQSMITAITKLQVPKVVPQKRKQSRNVLPVNQQKQQAKIQKVSARKLKR